MTPTRWQQVKELVADAYERADAAERAAFLAAKCADDTALRREVESLLAGSATGLEQIADDLRVSPEESVTGQRIGAYRIVSEIGRGGMGAVYLAERADDEFHKQVAIKLLKRGTDTDEVLRRFRSEREILARLEHPNIARLLDAGTTEDGLPYFVMEHVVGTRVNDYCFAQNLSIRERLQLFLKVCKAVQFAHQNLVVHRDLKPANILITAEAEPKLLDFGIAKLLAADEAAYQLTLQDQQRLTPAYASPEQVRGDIVTTVSDVYSLGALLYELLVGRSPHRFAATHPTATELWRVIGEESPQRPSLTATDKHLARQLRGDLDNILLTALRKEPARRYAGVGAFAEDLRRYLDRMPVRARPATFGYRAGKFISRNKIAVSAAAAALVVLIGGTVTTLINARRAQLEAQRAATHFNDVRQLANSFLFEFHDAIATLPGSTAARQLVVGRALGYLDKLARQATGERDLQLELAEAYVKVGDIQGKPYTANLGDSAGAVQSYRKAVEIASTWARPEAGTRRAKAREKLVRAQLAMASVQARLGDLQDASDANARALTLLQQLTKDAPQRRAEWQRLMAECHLGLGDAIQAGNHQKQDRELYRAAVEHYQRAMAPSEQLVAAEPQNVAYLRLLAKVCARIAGLLPGSRGFSAEAVDEALQLHARKTELQEKALALEPDNIHLRRNLADGLIATAYTRTMAERDLRKALVECARALAIQEPIVASDPSNKEALQDLSYAHWVTGRIRQQLGENSTAATHYRRAIEILEPLVAANPQNVETAFDLENARRGMAEVQQAAR